MDGESAPTVSDDVAIGDDAGADADIPLDELIGPPIGAEDGAAVDDYLDDEGILSVDGAPAQAKPVDAEPDAPEPEPAAEQTHTVTVDGKEETVTTEQLKKRYELAEASYKRFEEAAEMKRSVAEEKAKMRGVFERLQKGGPSEFADLLSRLGHDPVEMATVIIEEHLRVSKLTPEQREMENFRREKAQFDRQRAADEQARRQREVEAQVPARRERVLAEYDAEMDRAGLPKSDDLRGPLYRAMAERQLAAHKAGISMSSAEVFAEAWKHAQAIASQYISGLDAGALGKVLGDRRLDELRKQRLASLQSRPPAQRRPAPPAPAPKPDGGQYTTYASGDLDAYRRLLDG